MSNPRCEANMLLKKYYDTTAKQTVPFEAQKLFADLGTGCRRDALPIPEITRKSVISYAETLLDKKIAILPASGYMEFTRNGNRSNYESLQFERRKQTINLLFAEFFEGKGRFTDKLADFVWATLEESTWVLPAHNSSIPGRKDALTHSFGEKVDYIDLYSAETASLLSWVWYLGKDILDKASPLISERILYELDRRILKPFVQYDGMFWMGLNGGRVNNWNPWIVSNVLTVLLLTETCDEKREECTRRAMKMLDCFTSFYCSDGGCDEGSNYFSVAGESYFDCLELLYDLSGGKINVFGEKLVRAMGEYIAKVHINRDYYITFADSHAESDYDMRTIIRFGKRTDSELLYGFGCEYLDRRVYNDCIPQQLLYRSIKDSCAEYDTDGVKYLPEKVMWLDGIQIAALRQTRDPSKGLYLAMKGGNNAESHNHNDVGNFIVYSDGEPLFIDTGVGTYTRDTFNENRYKIFTMRSQYHNLPIIAGCDQKDGWEYEAKDVVFDDNSEKLSMQLRHAYPDTAGIESYVRSGSLDDNGIKICDVIKLKASSEIIFNLMSVIKPEITAGKAIYGDNTVEFSAQVGGKPEVPEILLDVIKLDDYSLIHAWKQNELYRLQLRFAPSAEISLTTAIR